MALNESDFSVSNGNDSSFLDNVGIFSFEECIGSSSLVSNHCSDKSGETIVGFGLFSFDYFDIDVIAVS